MLIFLTVVIFFAAWCFNRFEFNAELASGFLGVLFGAIITGAFQYWVSSEERKSSLRMAALEKRLAVHQEAYSLWIELKFSQDRLKVAAHCQEWWDKNCLYLSQDAREAFRKAYFAAFSHQMLTEQRGPVEDIKKESKVIDAAGEAIVRGASLPPIGDEFSRI